MGTDRASVKETGAGETAPASPRRAGEGIDSTLRVSRVQKAYEQVADQLRDLIVTGKIELGQRLPTEATLALEFGVSRSTIREALRSLAAQNLIRTAKGIHGGSFVTNPSVDHISTFLHSSINLLTEAQHVSLEEFLEVREFLEVPAARLAATRRSDHELSRLFGAIPDQPFDLTNEQQFVFNRDFHSLLMGASGNTLLALSAQPVFSVLQTNLARSALGRTFHKNVNHDHRVIAEAVAEGDAEAAAAEMHRHLEFLAPYYQRAWRHARREKR